MVLVAFFAMLGFSVIETQASAQTWSLTTAQRKAYLYYYAPIIMKRANESSTKAGLDWGTNFDFDQDGDFSNNRVSWLKINQYVSASASGSTGSYSQWRIRPTLYSALVEYMEGGSKSIVMLFHVYNAQDKDGEEIHDWERVEVAVRGVTGTPGGSGEVVNHVTVTHHHDHIMRRSYDSSLNFMQTATGKHVLIWQADQNDNSGLDDLCDTYGHELRFVKNSYSSIASRASVPTNDAEVNVSGRDSAKDVNYVFVPEGSQAAVTAWGAQPLTYNNATTLASRLDSTPMWSQVKRITYELQDLADIIPTHWQNNAWYVHWLADESEDVLLESPITNETGQTEVSTGLQRFYTKSRDVGLSGLTDGREGIPSKDWLFGAYSAELDEDCPSGSDDFEAYEGNGTDSYGLTRGAASGYYASHNAYWWQHDFFVHSGSIVDADTVEGGKWLTGAWYTAANGGFDGRWQQLFDDRPGADSTCTPPAKPTGVTATAVSPTQINVSWTASAGATSYRILRSATSGGPYTQVGISTTTSFANTGLSCNTAYYYVVQAVGACASANSTQASATSKACTASPPPVPAFLTVTPEYCRGLNSADWGSSTGASSYELYISTSSTFTTQSLYYSGPSLSASVNVSSTSYLRVRACNANGCSGYRNGDRTALYSSGCQ
ncbi:MAG: fibronectin type III domain-containing protein [Acidobacteriota bacterium]